MPRRLQRAALVAAAIAVAACTDIVHLTLDADPEVLSVTPGDGATGVDRFASVEIVFSEAIAGTAGITVLRGSTALTASISVAQDTATISFDPPLRPLTTYTAVVTTAVMDFDGRPVTNPGSWNFTTRDLAWTVAEPISPDFVDASIYYGVAVAVDREGNYWIPWVQGLNGSDVAIRRIGEFDSGPVELLDSRSDPANGPRVTVSDVGDLTVTWIQSDGVESSVWANRRVIGSWTGAQAIDFAAGATSQAGVVSDSSGNPIAVWTQAKSGGPRDVWANRFTSGTGWSTTPTRLDISEAGNAANAAVAGRGGSIAVAWAQATGSGTYDYLAARFVDGGWTAPIPLGISSSTVSEAEIGVDDLGRIVVCVLVPDLSCAYFDGNSWSTTANIASGLYTYAPLAVAPTGEAAIAAFRPLAMGYEVVVFRFDPTTGWGNAEAVDQTAGSPYDATIAIRNGDEIIVAYTFCETPQCNPRVARRTSAGWEAPQPLESLPDAVFQIPVTFRPDGTAIAVWAQSDGSFRRLWKSELR